MYARTRTVYAVPFDSPPITRFPGIACQPPPLSENSYQKGPRETGIGKGAGEMKYLTLIWAGIWRKRSRAVLMLLQIASAFLLFGLLFHFRLVFCRLIVRLRRRLEHPL